eukprot:COSAG01_NODE_1386_length_10508_cov_2.215850_9_plen_45_part_00
MHCVVLNWHGLYMYNMFMTITDLYFKLLSKCASLYGSGLERRKE